MYRVFDNLCQLSDFVLLKRIQVQDPFAQVEIYETKIFDANDVPVGTRSYAKIQSELSDAELIMILSFPLTAKELTMLQKKKEVFQNLQTISELQSLTLSQVETYINNTVTNLTMAKKVLAILLKIIILLKDDVWTNL